MKKLLLTLALAAVSAASFAQGKITIGNDSLHLLVNEGTGTPLTQAAIAGMSLQLFAGTSAGSMTLQTTIVGIGNAGFSDGRINNVTFTLVGIAASTQTFMQLYFYDTASGSYANAVNKGSTAVFTMTSGSFAPNSIVLHSAPGLSTWVDGPIQVTAVPEPASMALAGLGAASLLIFRRRK
jgi:hypothetical protein